MARPKKQKYEYVQKLGRYRKRIKDTDGRYVAIYGSTVKELEAKLADAQHLIGHVAFRRENPTVKEYAEKWLEMHAANVRATTMKDYASCVKIYIIEPLGAKYMDEITPDDVKLAMTKAATKSASVYRKAHMLYKMIFSSAQDSRIIDRSPCDKLNPKGGRPAKEKEALSPVQIQTLKTAVEGLPVETFVMLGLYAGLRREEALGLRWEHVHLEKEAPYISVRNAWHTENNRPVISSQLKTKAARRDIPIPDILANHLRQVRKTADSDHVIANREGDPLSETQWQRLWKGVTNRTTKARSYVRYKDGKPVTHTVTPKLGGAAPHNPSCIYSMDFVPTPHQLRHTYITNLLLAGTDVKTTQYLAGHERSKITLDIYAHLIYNRPEDLSDKVNKAFDT